MAMVRFTEATKVMIIGTLQRYGKPPSTTEHTQTIFLRDAKARARNTCGASTATATAGRTRVRCSLPYLHGALNIHVHRFPALLCQRELCERGTLLLSRGRDLQGEPALQGAADKGILCWW